MAQWPLMRKKSEILQKLNFRIKDRVFTMILLDSSSVRWHPSQEPTKYEDIEETDFGNGNDDDNDDVFENNLKVEKNEDEISVMEEMNVHSGSHSQDVNAVMSCIWPHES